MNRIFNTPLYYEDQFIMYNDMVIMYNAVIDVSVVENFFYPDYCVIYRGGGAVTATGVESFTGLFYGACGYDISANGSTSFKVSSWQADPSIIIQNTDILFQIGDKVVVSLANGRTIEATVRQFETQNEPGLEGTTLWLKGGRDE